MEKGNIIIKLLFISIIILIISCSNTTKDKQVIAKNDLELCNIDSICKEILETNEIQFLAKNLLDNFNSGISFLFPDSVIREDSTISIWVGYNGPDRWENYYTFYIKTGTCQIFIDDERLGTQTLSEWDRLMQKLNKNELFYDSEYDIYIEKNIPNSLDKKSTCVSISDYTLPKTGKIDISIVKYDTLMCDITGFDRWDCNDAHRYVALPSKEDILVILVPMDCGDFPYRFYLLTVKNNKVISSLYVEGEWSEPSAESVEEITWFDINPNYDILVYTKNLNNNTVSTQSYIILEDGEIIKKKGKL